MSVSRFIKILVITKDDETGKVVNTEYLPLRQESCEITLNGEAVQVFESQYWKTPSGDIRKVTVDDLGNMVSEIVTL